MKIGERTLVWLGVTAALGALLYVCRGVTVVETLLEQLR